MDPVSQMLDLSCEGSGRTQSIDDQMRGKEEEVDLRPDGCVRRFSRSSGTALRS